MKNGDRKTILGVCSWSLQSRTPKDLFAQLEAWPNVGCQLALDPLRRGDWKIDDIREQVDATGVPLLSGMMAMEGEDYSSLETIARTGGVRPDATFEKNLAAARENARIAEELGLELVTWHAGFLPKGHDDPEHAVIVERIQAISDAFGDRGIRIGLETGQERAETLIEVLAEVGREFVGVNFDPANMLLYGMGDPIDAIERLASHVVQIHIKDACASAQPGEWGTETPMGDGQVDWNAFFDLLRNRELHVGLVVEREGGDQRAVDIERAIHGVDAQLARVGRRR